tara:strand:+ start:106 stop:348 length:243 start_codon:yes stop_codon:yes gene_type:complete
MPKLGDYSSSAKPRSKYQRKYNSKHRPDNASRKRARRMLEGSGSAKPGDGKDVDHKDGNPSNNSRKNLRMRSKSANRGSY